MTIGTMSVRMVTKRMSSIMFKSISELLRLGNNLPVVVPAVDEVHIALFVLSFEGDLIDLQNVEVEDTLDGAIAAIMSVGPNFDSVSDVEVGKLVDCDGLGFSD
jgi:hypothetical protein